MSERKIINAISKNRVPQWGNKKKYIAIHYLGVVGQNHDLAPDGSGAHFYIYWDGTIYQRCSLDAIVWAVGTAGYYTQKHPEARNANTISIEMCCKCDGNAQLAEDPKWYFTKETQEACVWLVQKLMKENGISVENVLRHYDIVNKTCPAPYVHNNKYKTAWTWAEFKSRLTGEQVTEEQWYRVRRTWSDEKSQLGAYTNLDNAKANCPVGYSVFNWSGKTVYTNTAKGFQAASLKGLTEADRIAKIAPLYVESAKTTGMLPSVGIAQFILESGYGSTDLAEYANNLHGMKCSLSGNTWKGSTWDGKSKYGKYSPEVENGVTVQRYSEFRKYPCCEDSIADRVAYFTNAMDGSVKRYPGLVGEKNHEKAIRIIKAGRYATDPEYVGKLCEIVKRWKLTEYDVGFVGNEGNDGADILPDTSQPWYRVRRTWADAKSQIGAYHDLQKAKKCADDHAGYAVFDESGKQIYPEKQETKLHPILEQCKKYQVQLQADLAAGKKWQYRNPSKYIETIWSNALKKNKRACNCALLAVWAVKDAGLMPKNNAKFYGYKGGTIKWSDATRKAIEATCNVIKIGNRTVKQLIDAGNLQPGDIVTYVSLTHTNIYAGNGYWYDAGRIWCDGTNEGANFRKWYGKANYDNQKVGYIIRAKQSNQYYVQSGSFSVKANAEKLVRELKAAGFSAIIKKQGDQWQVQCGAFGIKANAEALVAKLKAAGFSAIIK